jgi:hypothetical protein
MRVNILYKFSTENSKENHKNLQEHKRMAKPFLI